MKLAKMELKGAEAKAETLEAKETERPKYPYGTSLYLDEVALAKLGIKEMPEVGQELRIEAIGKVVGTSSREYEGGAHQTLDIQLTDMACEVAGDEEESPARKLYGEA